MIDWGVIVRALIALGGAGLLIAVLLLVASLKLAVKIDEREAAVRAVLPGANCGACGFPGCDGYAAAVAAGATPLNRCSVGGPNVARAIGEIMGQDAGTVEPPVAVLICRGSREHAPHRFEYKGAQDCRQAALLLGGPKACVWGCVGLGHCVTVCPVAAITMGADGLPDIDEKKCVGCGRCVKECPKSTLLLIPRAKLVYLACVSHDKGKAVKDVCKVGCFACGICVKFCPTKALTMVDNLPVMDFARCIDCGICVHKCPTHSYVDRAPGRPKAVINPKCTGCQKCAAACLFKAIEGEPGAQHRVIADKCVGCGRCLPACEFKAIDLVGALGHSSRRS